MYRWLSGCDLVTKKCIFDILKNNRRWRCYFDIVVIWLQKNVSLIFWTTRAGYARLGRWLWFGYKKMYLWYSEQRKEVGSYGETRCDLVTKKCIFDILNNLSQMQTFWQVVVIWLQKNVSLIFWTTSPASLIEIRMLWFGYKKMYLWYSEQRLTSGGFITISCDLVTKKCIFDILNNFITARSPSCIVVIWLQKNVSLIFWTTGIIPELQDESCDLVTKKCIFDILNNGDSSDKWKKEVVIWLQKNVSLIFWTTRHSMQFPHPMLWFGYKKMYLWYSEQRT